MRNEKSLNTALIVHGSWKIEFFHIFKTYVNIDSFLIKLNCESNSNNLFWNLLFPKVEKNKNKKYSTVLVF